MVEATLEMVFYVSAASTPYGDSFESVNNVSHCTIMIEIIVINNFSSGFPPSTKTSPFRPKMSVNAETTQDHNLLI